MQKPIFKAGIDPLFFNTVKLFMFILAATQSLVYGDNNISTARAVGMANSYVTLARGIESSFWNPANLGLKDNPEYSLNLFSLGLRFGNNAFNHLDYNHYSGRLLTDSDIIRIIDNIPASGLKINSRGDLNLISASYRNVAFTTAVEANGSGTIAKDYLDLVLNGNQLQRIYDFKTTQASSFLTLKNILSIGIPFENKLCDQCALGLNIKHYKGLGFASLTHETGYITTTVTGIDAEGEVIARYAKGGIGWGADIGIAGEMHSGLVWGFSIINLMGNITWNKSVKEESAYFYANSVTVIDPEDSLYTLENYQKELNSIRYSQPKYFQIGLSRKYVKWLFASNLCIIWRQYKYLIPEPKFNLGVEYIVNAGLFLRSGLSFGGASKIAPAFGCGIRRKKSALDIGFAYQRSFSPYFAKGATIALSYSLWFDKKDGLAQ